MKLKEALRRMFDGRPVMVNLLEKAGIKFAAPCSSLEEIENKLVSMLGTDSSELIIKKIRQELEVP